MNTRRPIPATLKALRNSTLGLALGALLSSALFAFLLPAGASAESCPNEAFRSGPSANLPDCRAYEQVTPTYKNGGLFTPYNMGFDASGTSTFELKSFAAILGIESNEGVAVGGAYSVRRTESGWVTSPMALPASQYEAQLLSGTTTVATGMASLDDSSMLWLAQARSQPQGTINFVSRTASGTIADIGPAVPPGTPPPSSHYESVQREKLEPRGVSDDMSHVLFTMAPDFGAGYHFWPFDETEPGFENQSLYEYVGTGNTVPMLVGVDNQGKLISRCETSLGGQGAGGNGESHHAISGNGETVFFTAHACGSSPPVNELFARVDNGQPDAHTVAISEPSPEDCPACNTSEAVLEPGHFEGASQDGSTVFFTTTQPLLGGDSSENVYEYDFDPPAGEPKVVRVSGGDSTVSDPTAEVEGVVRTSEDGSHVYFVARGVLTKTANSQGQVAQAAANNFYVYERDAQYPAGQTKFIADLSNSDSKLWGPDANRPADATPDGRFLVFVSNTDLTPDDTSSDAQVLEYDAQTGNLVRVSKGENGYNDNGNSPTERTEIVSPNFSEYQEATPQQYWAGLTMSADGSYVFFDSTLGLTPQALNNAPVKSSAFASGDANNVYEYHEGHVYLISDGQDVGGFVYLQGTDASGRDVFLTSSDQLAPSDTDSDIDLFDARIDGGFPAPAQPAECSGDGCQGPLSAAPVLLSPGSEFQAGGNPPLAATPAPTAKPKQKLKKKTKAKKRKKAKRSAARRASRRVHAPGKAGRS